MMSTLRNRKEMNLFADGYLFGIVDVVYQKGKTNPDYDDMELPNNVEQLELKPEKTVRVGFMGLLYKSWIETSILNLKDFKLEKCFSVAKELAQMMKKKFKCDMVVAVTHMSNDEDMNLQNFDSDIDISNIVYFFLIFSAWRT